MTLPLDSASAVQPPWWGHTRRLILLALIGLAVGSSAPQASFHGRGLASLVLIVVTILARIPWIFNWPGPRTAVASVVVSGCASIALAFVSPDSAAIAFTAFAVADVAQLASVPTAVSVSTVFAVAYVVGQVTLDQSTSVLLLGPGGIAAGTLIGIVRKQRAELTLQAQSARDEHARLAALDERSRIAREIHDVLAHSLAALTVQLETADALLESGRNEQAHVAVLRSSQLAREGLTETRRAISALRGDTLPLPELLSTLAAAYQADLDGTAEVHVEGEPRDVRPDLGLALYRTAQEAITNIRKHAPGAQVEIDLRYAVGEVTLTITNDAAPDGDRPLSATGGGYGLTGLRERAELAGGSFSAGPNARGWRVSVRIPA